VWERGSECERRRTGRVVRDEVAGAGHKLPELHRARTRSTPYPNLAARVERRPERKMTDLIGSAPMRRLRGVATGRLNSP
jgi:hypothetical protein